VFLPRTWNPGLPNEGDFLFVGERVEALEEAFPNFRDEVTGKAILDFGCGHGYQSVAFSQAGARIVFGLDILKSSLDIASNLASGMGLSDRIAFADRLPDDIKFDVIVSQNSFEHFIDAEATLASMRSALDPNGKIFITFGPPWYAPWGGHMAFFCRLPWVQVLFPERTVIEVRSRFRSDNATTYRDVQLARMSLRKFRQIIKRSGLRCSWLRNDCALGMNWLRHTPLREFFVVRVSCVLTWD
jgi:SAM-dependent methyltransferase